MIDEVQYAPQVFRHLKIAIDADRHRMGTFILTGSQKFVLMKGVSDSLAGRCGIFELETLSLEEIAEHQPYPERLEDLVRVLVRGGFPELYRDPSIDGGDFYRAYLSTYLERDVRQLLNVASLRDFERFIRACAARSGQILDKARLARDVGVSTRAVNDWLSVLEASNQVQLLEPYFGNIGKRLVKSPKLYFSDTGLLCYLLGLDESTLGASSYVGSIWEAALFAQLRKERERRGSRDTFWFYRDQQQNEVDFLIASGGTAHLVEAKWTENPDALDARGLEVVAGILRKKSAFPAIRTHLVCRTPHPSVREDGTSVIGVGALLARGWPRPLREGSGEA